jgi:hypothetical protein
MHRRLLFTAITLPASSVAAAQRLPGGNPTGPAIISIEKIYAGNHIPAAVYHGKNLRPGRRNQGAKLLSVPNFPPLESSQGGEP